MMKRIIVLFFALLFFVSCFAQIKTFNSNPNVIFNKTATNPTWKWLEGKWMMMGFVKNNVLLTEGSYSATIDSLKKMLRNESIAKDSAKANENVIV
jgi:hypothetical protein